MQDIGLAAAPTVIQGLPSLTHIPMHHACSGIYFLCLGEEVVYIGQAVQVIARVCQHIREGCKKFDHARMYYIPCRDWELAAAEAYYVALYKPRLNGNLHNRTIAEVERLYDIPLWIERDPEREAAADAAPRRDPPRNFTVRVGAEFWGLAVWNKEAQEYSGRFAGKGRGRTFSGATREEVRTSFKAQVDDYLSRRAAEAAREERAMKRDAERVAKVAAAPRIKRPRKRKKPAPEPCSFRLALNALHHP